MSSIRRQVLQSQERTRQSSNQEGFQKIIDQMTQKALDREIANNKKVS